MPRGAPLGNKFAKGHGRPKGTPNKVTTQVKEMILAALDDAGGQAYLAKQANKNAPAFMALLAKILPRDMVMELEADVRTAVQIGFDQEQIKAFILAVTHDCPTCRIRAAQRIMELEAPRMITDADL